MVGAVLFLTASCGRISMVSQPRRYGVTVFITPPFIPSDTHPHPFYLAFSGSPQCIAWHGMADDEWFGNNGLNWNNLPSRKELNE